MSVLPPFLLLSKTEGNLSVSEHQGGTGGRAGRAEQHQKGQVHATGQSRRAEKQHEDRPAAEPATQTGPQTEPSQEGKAPLTVLCNVM